MDCTCCECVTFNNYRGQRMLPTSLAPFSFSAWCNSERQLFETETALSQYTAGDDVGGPFRLTTDGKWYDASGAGLNTNISGGALTLHGVFGSEFTLQSAGPADGFQLAAFQSVAQFKTLTYEHQPPATGVTNYSIQLEISGSGSPTGPTGPTGGGEASTIASARTGWVWGTVTNKRITLTKWSSAAFVDEPGPTGIITASTSITWPGASDGPTPGLTPNPRWLTNREIKHPFTITPTGPTGFRPSRAEINYYNNPVRIEGAAVSLYRNGQLVWEATRPTGPASEPYTTEDGVYLLASVHSESSDPPYAGTGPDTRLRTIEPLVRWRSFVIDKDQPRIGIAVPRDWFIDEAVSFRADAVPPPGHPFVTATKPMAGDNDKSFLPFPFDLPSVFTLSSDDVHSPLAVRPDTMVGQNMSWMKVGGNEEYLSLPTGTHTLEPRYFRSIPITELHDRAGNYVSYTPTVTVTVHPVPANNRRGARPQLEDIGLQTREYYRARYEHEAVAQVLLTFDRKVDATTVADSQLTLTKDGVEVEGCTLQQLSDTEWMVTIPPEAEQTPGSFWILTYAPAGEVLTDDIDEIEYVDSTRFPGTGQYRRVYKDTDAGKRYSWSPSGYVEIGDALPRDENGVDFEPEPCLLASRISWLMAKDWLVPIDTATTGPITIGMTMSSTKTIDDMPADDGLLTFAAPTGTTINNWGTTRSGLYADGYAPMVPPPSVSGPTGADWFFGTAPFVPTGSTGATGYSYFGLGTTIYPSPPKQLRCPSPSVAQRHASVVRSTDDIPSIAFKLVITDQYGNLPPANSYAGTFRDVLLQERTASSTISQKPLQQNTWYAAIESEGGDGECWLNAYRQATTYTSLQTSVLSELVVRWWGYLRLKPSGNFIFLASVEELHDVAWVLSREQEDALASGDAVRLPITSQLSSTVPSFADPPDITWLEIRKA